MPQTFRYFLHSFPGTDHDGTPVAPLWPSHKPLEEVLELRDTTPPNIWEGTYQGNPTPPEGSIFFRSWWSAPETRYDPEERRLVNQTVARWLSWDTGLKDEEDNAYSALIVGELLPDYRLVIRHVFRERLIFPDLPEKIAYYAHRFNRDEKLRAVIIEDKASGTSALQTLRNTAESWLTEKIVAFLPTYDKETRAQQAAVWCRNACILLPHPSPAVPWLMDFEDELFDFPGSVYKDQVDAFSQLILWTENLLAEGWRMRTAVK